MTKRISKPSKKSSRSKKPDFYKETDQYKFRYNDLTYAYRAVLNDQSQAERDMKDAAMRYANAKQILDSIDEQLKRLRDLGEKYL